MSGAPSSQNPLLGVTRDIPFDLIQPEHVEPAIEILLKQARHALDCVSQNANAPTFENTLLAMESATEELETVSTIVGHLESVATTPALREAYNKVDPLISEFYSSIPLDEGLWAALQAFEKTEEARQLTGAHKRFLEKTLDDFRRHGAELDNAGKAKLSAVNVELSRITTLFRQNVLDATNEFELLVTDEDRLRGLPASAKEAARESALTKEQEGWRFTLQAPSFIPVMTYLDDAEIREQVFRAQSTLASSGEFDNRSLVAQILELRSEKARLLGYENFADLVLHERMAKTGLQAQTFCTWLKDKTIASFHQENKDLEDFFQKHLQDGASSKSALNPWDLAYGSEKQRQADHAFDEEQLRPYFPLTNVISGMFQLVQQLYGITIEEIQNQPVWDPSVLVYRILDGDPGRTCLGLFYVDLYPRETKRGGAWMNAFITGGPIEKGFDPHVGLICGNLTPPVGDQPALLSHRDVETLFHEFGHLLHHCLSRAEIRSQAGTNVVWDFVELPSQIMENWCWNREALDLFAAHVETGKKIPDTLFARMTGARNFRSAYAMMRQLGFASVDLALHMNYQPEAHGDVSAYARQLTQEFSAVRLPDDYSMITSFGHLFGSSVGYGAGYYSYKWAEVLDADAFTRFEKEGVFSPEVGDRFRREILEKGDSEDASILFQNFMGRAPNPDAILKRSGLLQ
jgi:oligopeptidase A